MQYQKNLPNAVISLWSFKYCSINPNYDSTCCWNITASQSVLDKGMPRFSVINKVQNSDSIYCIYLSALQLLSSFLLSNSTENQAFLFSSGKHHTVLAEMMLFIIWVGDFTFWDFILYIVLFFCIFCISTRTNCNTNCRFNLPFNYVSNTMDVK